MKIQNPDEYDFIRFEESKSKNKKYDAILKHKESGKEKRVPFGDKKYEQYEDNTGLGLYSKMDHHDEKRREKYKKRHSKDKDSKFSSGFFSDQYLW